MNNLPRKMLYYCDEVGKSGERYSALRLFIISPYVPAPMLIIDYFPSFTYRNFFKKKDLDFSYDSLFCPKWETRWLSGYRPCGGEICWLKLTLVSCWTQWLAGVGADGVEILSIHINLKKKGEGEKRGEGVNPIKKYYWKTTMEERCDQIKLLTHGAIKYLYAALNRCSLTRVPGTVLWRIGGYHNIIDITHWGTDESIKQDGMQHIPKPRKAP